MSGPDYESYSLKELEEAKASINKEKYPDRYNEILKQIENRTEHITKYKCVKCGNNQCDIEELRATGDIFTKFFDVQNQHFTTVTCKRCKYTELYKCESNVVENFLDFFIGS